MQWDQECPPLTAVQEDTVVVVAPLLGGKGDLDVQVQTGVEAALGGGTAQGPVGRGTGRCDG